MTKEIEAFTKINGVVAKLEGAENLTVVFRPGTLPSVAEITFKGNKAIPTTRLQEAVTGAGIGAVFTENRFRQILEASVRPVYEALGYLDVQFPTFDVTPAKNVDGIAVTVQVNEGEVYKLASVDFKGELEEVNTKELMKVGGFETDTVANFDKIRSGVEDIRKALRRKGFIEASTSFDRKLDKEKKTVAVTVSLVPNAQFTMGNLRIEGLDIETEPHIRKMWGIKKGSPFNVEYPDHFLDEVRNVLESLGRTRSTITPNPDRQTVDVTLQFEGEKPAKKPPIR
jgi:outer membrane protein insertion porin family